jgi:hypothetical protein
VSFGDDDLAYMLGEDFGVDVVYSGTTVKGIVDEMDEAMLAGHMVSQVGRIRSVLVKTGSIAPVPEGSITVNGTVFKVYDVREEAPDGRLTRVFLAA